mmetsp:Transcript_120873/g.235339  ORF Transcript_120873/g.235339 Transcript_120873/m.235339 type:complete len:530 (+) Transcript_120873:79-1668(+)
MLRLVICLATSTLPALAGPGFFGPPTHVAEFKPSTFVDTVSNDTRVWIVTFYADWCGHCIHYAPVFKSIANRLQKEEDRLQFGAVNCAMWYEFCSTVDVHSYPSMRAYHTAKVNPMGTKGFDVQRSNYAEEQFVTWIQPLLPARTSKTTRQPQNPRKQLNKLLSNWTNLTKRSSSNGNSSSYNSSAANPGAGSITTSPLTLTKPALSGPEAAAMHLVDAEVAVLYSLRHGAFLAAKQTVSSGSTMVLEGAVLLELRNWLVLLAALLPSINARRDILVLEELVSSAQASTAGLGHTLWIAALDKQGLDTLPPEAGVEPNPFWRSCKSYTCGLWTLFHILTVAATEQRPRPDVQGLLSKRSVLPQPHAVLVGIRNFVANFFGCSDCVANFLQTFDSCGHNRCNLDHGDGVGMALWLWEVHNGVSQRVAQERQVPEGGKPWPSNEDCRVCRLSSSGKITSWDRQAVYSYLQATYWRPEWTLLGQERTLVYTTPTFDSYQLWGIASLVALSCLAWRMMQRSYGLGGLQREKGS